MWITPGPKSPAAICLLLLLCAGCLSIPRGAPEPYQCGFILNRRKDLEKVMAPEMKVVGYRAGEVVADVGASNGFHMGMVSVLVDSMTIYLEDIDSLCLNAEELAKVIHWHEWLKGGPIHSQFHTVLGTETQTRLPEATFDKVVVTAALHHFSDPPAMLADIRAKLKPGGRLYVIENVVKTTGDRRKSTCQHPLRSEADLVALFVENGLRVEGVHSLHRDWTKIFVMSALGD